MNTISELKDPNDPEGRSYKEINLATPHNIPIGTLVELESGARLFVVHHARDCDGTPLYCLSFDKHDTVQCVPGRANRSWYTERCPEDSLKIV